jgi:UDP-glucose:(heptosyl)LPS alpha-1,3-glucosyltransferase
MKVALVHIRHANTGGTERYLNCLAAHLASLGHQVVIVCQRHEVPPHPATRFEVLRSFALSGARRMLAFAKAVEQHVAQARYDVVLGLGKTWTQDVIRLGGGCYQTYLDCVHQASRWPFVRSRGAGGLKTRLALTIETRALAPGAYTHVITNSEMVKRDVMARYGLSADEISVIHNGVDLERFHPRHRLGAGAVLRRQCGFHAGHVVVVFLGTGYHRKGLDRLLAVFPALLHKRPEVRLLVVGYDSSLGQWEAHASHLGLSASVCFLGGRRDPEICYGAGDLYVLPTRYDPFANATLEALASGMPVITTSTNGGCDVLEQGVHGAVLRDQEDHAALLWALLQWTDRAQLRQGAQAARAQAERYGILQEMQASMEVLSEVAATKKRARR